MKESDVILAPLSQADEELKYRPAIVLREMPTPYRDILVCGVSTNLNQYVHAFDDIISPTDADFALSGLRSESLIRLSFLAVIPRRLVRGTIGSISEERHKRLLQRLVDYLTSSNDGLLSLWTRSKFVASAGSVSIEVLKQYIENQKGV